MFRKCGIIPLDRTQVLNVLPKENNDETVQQDVDNVVVSLLKSLRYSDAMPQRRKRKKIQVEAGKSVSGQEFTNGDSEREITDEGQERNK